MTYVWSTNGLNYNHNKIRQICCYLIHSSHSH